MAALADLLVIAPVPLIDYGNPHKQRFQSFAIPKCRREPEFEIHHPRWLYPPFGGSINSICLGLRVLPLVARIRKRFAFDIIDAHFGHPEAAAAALLARVLACPYTVTLRGNETRFAEQRVRRAVMTAAFRRAGRIISVSNKLRDFAIRLGVDGSQAVTIPNGVDTALFFPRDSAACRRKHGIAEGSRCVLSAGFLIERKGHHRIMQALSELAAKGLSADLIIAGGPGREDRYETEIRRRASELGMTNSVHFAGHVAPETLAELMSAADLLCLASTREGWPNVVHEAMACGTPVVSTNVGGVPDMIPLTDYGLIVPAGDAAALRDALALALSRSWDRRRIAAWAHSRSWQQVAHEVIKQFEQVLDRGKCQ
jgi:glycosyltransferase involved in cell wall biosynthesis